MRFRTEHRPAYRVDAADKLCLAMPDSRLLDAFFRKLEQRDVLSGAERAALIAAARPEEDFAAGTDLVLEGDRPDHSILLLDGFATRYRLLGDGQRQITAVHVAGDFVDLHSFLLKDMDHSVGALTRCHVLTFPRVHLARITETEPHLTRLLWLMTLIDAAMHREWMVAMGRRSALEQLAHLVCELYVRLGIAGLVTNDQFIFPVTQSDLGDALGLSAVHVNRVLQQLRAGNLITWQGQLVHILDWPGLQRLAEFDPRYLHLNNEPR